MSSGCRTGLKILVCDSVSDEGLKILSSAGFNVTYEPKISGDELVRRVGDYDVVVVRSRSRVTRDVVEAGLKLKLIGRAGVGVDNIDVEAAESRGIMVLNTPEASSNAVAELVIGLMICLARGIALGDSALKQGRWLKSELMGFELQGRILGIVGVGRIGGRITALAKAFGMKILAYDVIPIREELKRDFEVQPIDLNTLLSQSDFITLHVPLTRETRHLISREKLALMKKTAYVINASRGGVIDEEALIEALKKGSLKGVALDVFEVEPPLSSELIKLPNVLCTPHIGGQTFEAQKTASIMLAEKIINFFKKTG